MARRLPLRYVIYLALCPQSVADAIGRTILLTAVLAVIAIQYLKQVHPHILLDISLALPAMLPLGYVWVWMGIRVQRRAQRDQMKDGGLHVSHYVTTEIVQQK